MPGARRPAVAIETHGCKLNQADSESLARQFLKAGFRLVSIDEPADVYVVNTCTVTHIADRKARHALRAASRRNPKALIVATGCYAQRSPDSLARANEVGMVIGNIEKTSLVQQVLAATKEAPVPCAVGTDSSLQSYAVGHTRAMIKIQEGCNQVCAYCIVPKVRGRECSIPSEHIVAQVETRVAEGYKEVVLTGTQLGSYGFELPGIDLELLVKRILDETRVERLRISSLQPQEITRGLMALWADPRLCPHFHIPLQSGSDSVLKRMRRRYSAQMYSEKVQEIRREVSNVSITTDVLVGFPGETEAEFEQTYALCQTVGFASMHVFPYSSRPGTSAAHFQGAVDPRIKRRRMGVMLKLAREQATNFRGAFLGSTRPVLWEEAKVINDKVLWSGLTDNYIRVYTEGLQPLTNRLTPARLLREDEDLMYCQIVEKAVQVHD